jgi:hypothetical protein
MKRLTRTSAQPQLRSNLIAPGHRPCLVQTGESDGGRQRSSRTPTRFLSTTAATKTAHDDSTIDTVNTPSVTPNAPPLPEVMRPPLLPDNDSPPPGTAVSDKEAAIEPVIRPEITTVCADGTHIDTPSAMSEVTDNHAADLDPYDLASKVTAAAAKPSDVATKKVEEPGSAKALWNGLLDDLFGEKKVSKT